jgi:hypothetical protein
MNIHLFAGRKQLVFAVSALSLASLAILVPAQAQPDLNNAPKADNPTNRPVGIALTPEQRAQQRLRRQLQLLGINQLAVQDTLIAYIETETKAHQAVVEKGLRLQTGLRGNALSDAQVAALLNDYQAAIEEDRARRSKAQADLLKNVDITKMPKVEATLILMGVYGDGPILTTGLTINSRGRDGAARRTTPGVPRGFGQAAPNTNQPRPTQPNIKPPVTTPAQI